MCVSTDFFVIWRAEATPANVGLSPEQRSKLMREVTASERGTNAERGNGLGLFLVGAMLQGEALKVVFDSPDVGGTIVKVLG